jgi:hypothetical protein
LHAGVAEALLVFLVEFEGAEAVDDAVDLDAGAGAFAERFDEPIAELA